MKRFVSLIVACFITLVFSFTVNAALIDNGDGTVTDDDQEIMWLQTPVNDMSWDDAVAFADSYVFAGYDNWRLPSALDFDTGAPDEAYNSMNNEFGHLYGDELSNPANTGDIVPLIGYEPLWFWTSTEADIGTAYAFFWSFDNLWLNQTHEKDEVLHVTLVRDMDPVPVPGSIFLLTSGLLFFAGYRKK